MKNLFSVVISLVLIAGCQEKNELKEAELEILYLKEAALGFENDSTKAKSVFNKSRMLQLEEYDLGDFPESGSAYFLIVNRGDEVATDVELDLFSELTGITLSKTEFTEVLPFEGLGYDDLLTDYLFRVDITHGEATADEEETLIQPMGDQSAMLVARSELQALQSESKINFNILLAELKIFDENGEVELGNPSSATLTGGFEAQTFVPNYPTGQNAKVINTGNVDLPIQVFNTITWKEDYMLAPGDSINVRGDRTVTIALKETEAVRDREVFPVVSNNKCYFALDRR